MLSTSGIMLRVAIVYRLQYLILRYKWEVLTSLEVKVLKMSFLEFHEEIAFFLLSIRLNS